MSENSDMGDLALLVGLDHPPAHRDKAATNGAQLLMAHGDSGLMSGPPAKTFFLG
jgi:hypothetical protein